MTTTQVSRDVALFCLDETGQETAFVSSLTYDRADPWAVWLTFHLPTGDVPWAMARDLLTGGLTEPAGEGDLRLRPELDEDGRAVVRFDFSSPDGHLVARAHTRALAEFLTRTFEVVPRGREADATDLDALVLRLVTPTR